jgi:uncharacterized protein (TIGR02996 family)
VPVFLYPPTLEVRAVIARFDRPMGALPPSPAWIARDEPSPVALAMTELLARFGRSRARPHGAVRVRRLAVAGTLPAIAPVVDLANRAAADTGFPIAVVDLDRLHGALRFSTTREGLRLLDERGVSRDVGKLPCVADAHGPCITPAAIRQDVGVTASTMSTLSVFWAHARFPTELAETLREHHMRLEQLGAVCEGVEIAGPGDDPVGRSLLQMVLDDPEDDHTRLVFADWLEMSDNACHQRRARLIREAVAGREVYELQAQVELDLDLEPMRWQRGFVHRIDLGASRHRVEPALHREPVVEVSVHNVPHDALPATVQELAVWQAELGPIPLLAPSRIRKLQASGYPTRDFWPWLASLRSLTWLSLRIGQGDRARLPALTLNTLHVEGGRLDAAVLATLAPTLETLYLNDVVIDRIPRLPHLRKVTLYRMHIDSLASLVGLPLRELHLDVGALSVDEAPRILSIESLETLGVHGNRALADELTHAIDHGALPHLRAVYGLHPGTRDLRPR